jgi:hypothetical protein
VQVTFFVIDYEILLYLCSAMLQHFANRNASRFWSALVVWIDLVATKRLRINFLFYIIQQVVCQIKRNILFES